MPSSIGRNLNLCFAKFKPTAFLPSPLPLSIPNSSDSNSIHNPHSLFVKNFNSLYDSSLDCHPSTPTVPESEIETTTPPDFATAFASQRFFFSSPGRSNSIFESSSSSSLYSSSSSSITSSPGNPEDADALLGGVGVGHVAIPTLSPDPYMDFRRSMQEMVEAREVIDVRANSDYLHELLMCYLSLNPKSTHKFIVGAFADLLVSLVDGGRSRRES